MKNELFEVVNNFSLNSEKLKLYNDICLYNNFKGLDISNLDFISIDDFITNYDKNIDEKLRNATGSFYTPINVCEFMVYRAIYDYIKKNTEIKLHILEKLFYSSLDTIYIKEYHEIYKLIIDFKVIDLASGTGNLIKTFIYKLIDIRKKLLLISKFNIELINLNNFFCLDKQVEPLNICLYDLIRNIDKDHIKNFNINLINCNTITDMIDRKDYVDILEKGGFDIVIGNPPYIGEKGNKVLFDEVKKSEFGIKYYEGKMDFFYYFIYKGISILKKSGILVYLTTSYFITADGAKKLRCFLKKECEFNSINNFKESKLFKDAPGQHNIVYSLSIKGNTDANISLESYKYDKSNFYKIVKSSEFIIKQSEIYDNMNNILILEKQNYYNIINKILDVAEDVLFNYADIKQGIVSGADKVTKRMVEHNLISDSEALNKGIFIVLKEEALKYNLESELLKPLYKNSHIKNYFFDNKTDKYIIFINKEIKNIEIKYPNIYKHLSGFRTVLEKRREVKKGYKPWYALQWGRDSKLFETIKIINPQRAKFNYFALSKSSFYSSADVYYLKIKRRIVNQLSINNEDEYYYLLALLNSKLYFFWFYNVGKKKGDMLELYSNPIQNIPIISNDLTFFKTVVSISKKIYEVSSYSDINNDKFKTLLIKLDKIIYEKFKLTDDEIIEIEYVLKKGEK
ncbi:Eco57I restriction-modification methylase domain-containing protein [Helicovermis profundi]|uniref:site-specific DNA-methyltransferase (adenine-specific) n=1 Tax=Helicovermis profundi TaxID=3065157 RepID=A0AAU9E8C3_9FIRM|nr:N-6 DNA methylase [Clostridia bacterium S502]